MMVTERVGSSIRVTDYSAQWAEYYRSVIWSEVEHFNMFLYCRSLGMLKEAEIIEQQMMAARYQPQPDYSAQWADYYR